MLEYLDECLFTWSRWRSGSPVDIGIVPFKESYIISNRDNINKFSVGYCDAEKLICRPKTNHKAIMFFKEDEHFWFHITNKEFVRVFE